MHLTNNIGKLVYISLTEVARKTTVLDMFYECSRNNDLISNKLLGVDHNGVWIEGFKKFTRLVDENNQPIPIEQQVEEDGVYSIFVSWNHIEGIFIDHNEIGKRIGF